MVRDAVRLPDCVIEGEAPGHVHGSGLGLHCQVPPIALCIAPGSAAAGLAAPWARALAVIVRPHSTASAAHGKIFFVGFCLGIRFLH